MHRKSILIVGGGPTGLTAALELGRRGIHCRIIERREAPSPLSRAVGIMPNTMKLLEPSGASALLKKEAIQVSAVEINLHEKPIFTMPMNQSKDPSIGLFCLPQDVTEHILAERASHYGINLEYGVTLDKLTINEDGGVDCVINGKAETYDYVLGADGSRSIVRDQIGYSAEGYDLESEWSIADVEAPQWSDTPGVFRVFLQEGGVVVFVIPMSETRYRLVSTQPNALETLNVDMPIEKLYREGDFRIGVRQVAHYRKGPVFLAGDAAHQHSPVGGRGMNLGIADAVHFASCFAKNKLDNYSEDRHKIGADTIEFTEHSRKKIMSDISHSKKRMLQMLNMAALIPGIPGKLTEKMVSGEF